MVSYEVNSEPDLETDEHKCGKNTHPCLEKPAFICEYCTYTSREEHDEHYQVWYLFVIPYVDVVSFRTDDGSHTAEKHRCSKNCRYADI